MLEISRRTFHRDLLGSLLTWSLLDTVLSNDLLADDVKLIAGDWLARIDDMSRDLKGEALTQLQWQEQVEELFTRVDLAELLRFLDFDRLTDGIEFRERGERTLTPSLPEVEGLPTELVYGHQIFALTKGRSVVPHGHDNMATAFLVLQGDFHGRHYDRLEDDGDFMIIKPTIDREFTAAEFSTISDHKDNVHWFTAESDTAFIYNIHVLNVEEGRQSGRVYIDPNGEAISDDRIRAKRLKAADAFRLYG